MKFLNVNNVNNVNNVKRTNNYDCKRRIFKQNFRIK